MEPIAGIEPASPSLGPFTLEFTPYLASFDDQNKPLVYSAPDKLKFTRDEIGLHIALPEMFDGKITFARKLKL